MENTPPVGPLIDRIANELGLLNPVSVEFLRVVLDNTKLFDKKQSDYGPRNISDYGTIGCVIRANDKMNRLKQLLGKGKRRRPKNESIMDSLRDLSNYAVIAILLETSKWPE